MAHSYVAIHQIIMGNNETVAPGTVLSKLSDAEAAELLSLGAIELVAQTEAVVDKKPAPKKAAKEPAADSTDSVDPFSGE